MEESTSLTSESSESSSTLPSNSSNGTTTTLKVGDAVQLDELGPIIINTDGTTTRISNWSSMNQQEKGYHHHYHYHNLNLLLLLLLL